MFFFIGGITPKTKRLDNQPLRCPNCGKNSAFRSRMDHWLHLFFIPVFPVKRGSELVFCESCRMPVNPGAPAQPPPQGPTLQRCPACGNLLEKGFRYCPACGQRLQGDPG